MKYTAEITIDLPRDEFVKKLDDAETMKHWQKGLVAYTFISDTQGQEGSKMELHYTLGKREFVIIETIIRSNFPVEFHATYDTKGVHSLQKNYFGDVEGTATKWISESEIQVSSPMMKLLVFIKPGIFKKQSMKYLKDFKAFAEQGISVAKN